MNTIAVSAGELRRRFNDACIWERVAAGELIEQVAREGTPKPANKQPEGTTSVSSFICEPAARPGSFGRRVAFVHYYRLADGTINNQAKKPDPKFVVVDGVKYALETTRSA